MTVRLRPRSDGDAGMLYEIFSDLETWEERNPAPPRPLTRAEFQRKLDDGGYDGGVHFVVEFGGVPIGRCTLMDEDSLTRSAEVGIALLASARGQGAGTEALRQLVEFAFVRRNLRRLYLYAIASNAAGIGAYRKVGFVEEGRRREHCWVRGAYEDEVLMGLLRSEWAAARDQ